MKTGKVIGAKIRTMTEDAVELGVREGGFEPGSPEAKAAIERVRLAMNTTKKPIFTLGNPGSGMQLNRPVKVKQCVKCADYYETYVPTQTRCDRCRGVTH